MKAHPGITRLHLVQKGAAAIALMVASEFGRASNRHAHEGNVRRCYERARELMGVLETLPLPASVARCLKPLYTRSTQQELYRPGRLEPGFVRKACAELAESFNRAATRL